MMSVYAEETLARVIAFGASLRFTMAACPHPGRIRPQGWPLRRIVVLPLVLFVVVSAGVFTLAKLHPASPATASGPVTLGDVAHGKVVFLQKCAPCHGTQAEGKVGPRLAGVDLTVEEARAQIDNGGGIMPREARHGRQRGRRPRLSEDALYSGRFVMWTTSLSSSPQTARSATWPVVPSPS